MTLALIVAIIYLCVWGNDRLNRSEKALDDKKKTITNVPLQDYFSKLAFMDIMDDLYRMDKLTPLVGERLIDAIEFLFEHYDIPDERTEQERAKDREQHLHDVWWHQKSIKDYPQDESMLPLPNRIWHNLPLLSFQLDASWQNYQRFPELPFVNNPDLLFGEPNSILYTDNPDYKTKKRAKYEKEYGTSEGFENSEYCDPKEEPPKGKQPLLKYDKNGFAKGLGDTVPGKLIDRVQGLLVRRDLVERGYHMAYGRHESYWQELDKSAKEHEKKKEKYPWLYKDIDHDYLLRK